ncbi:amidohydrolase family protein [Rubinisphaera margarita]|uniref:amidohydrolase family protein n=1 Tax=Rubinisphaera margarita TaxID=2909586 RepID=UPI001EE7A3AE|nr:amidohydrolase family protein [Rubinisphaera margarita]MCG6157814.1 amidohydrolase family protein [Rubinisphaera margarita]
MVDSFSLFVSLAWLGPERGLLRDVSLRIEDGQIASIVPDSRPEPNSEQRSALIPPLVNAHCHLEFSHLEEPLQPAHPFQSWIGRTVQTRRENADPARSIKTGLDEAARCGVHRVADIATQTLDSYPARKSTDVAACLFRELIGVQPESIASQRQLLDEFLTADTEWARGISPHAPYSVHPDLLEYAIDKAVEHQLPVTMHLAETRSELEFLRDGTGDFVDMLTRFGIWSGPFYPPETRPLDLMKRLASAPRVLLAHCNYLSEDEIEYLAAHPQMAAIYCPRTHAFFKHDPHPWQKLLEQGAQVALGTDGRGSSPDLSIWNEILFLAERFPDVDPALLLSLGTTRGAAAMGWDWTFEVGQPARFTLLDADGPPESLSQLLSDHVRPIALRRSH